MTNRIDRLEAAGLVRRLPDPDDRRALKVELTELGHDIWRQSIVVQGGKEALLASALDPEEKEQLSMLLRLADAGLRDVVGLRRSGRRRQGLTSPRRRGPGGV